MEQVAKFYDILAKAEDEAFKIKNLPPEIEKFKSEIKMLLNKLGAAVNKMEGVKTY